MADIRIAGSGKVAASGNVYDYVSISGSGRIEGTLHCKSVSTAGSGHLEGDVFCEGKISTAGSCRFDGDVECDVMSTAGSASVDKNIRCNVFKTAGSTRVGGNVEGKEIRIAGVLDAKGDVSGEEVAIAGSATIGGLLNAENIEIKLNGTNKIGEIGCTRIEVHPEHVSQFSLFGMRLGGNSRYGKLICKVIEGDDISLVLTEAAVVRGKTVKIGAGCEIDRVEYSESIEIDDKAKVKEQIKI